MVTKEDVWLQVYLQEAGRLTPAMVSYGALSDGQVQEWHNRAALLADEAVISFVESMEKAHDAEMSAA